MRCKLSHKGAWAAKHSWRVQCKGRAFKAGMRVRRQFGSPGRGTRARSALGHFVAPVAVCALHGFIVAVCDAGARAVVLFDVHEDAVIRRIAVDGIPTGACLFHFQAEETPWRLPVLTITVQARDEAGNLLDGVHSCWDRIEMRPVPELGPSVFEDKPWWYMDVIHSRRQQEAFDLWLEYETQNGAMAAVSLCSPWFGYPNGACADPTCSTLFCANWNQQDAGGFDFPCEVLWAPISGTKRHEWMPLPSPNVWAKSANGEPLNRPSDVEWLDVRRLRGKWPFAPGMPSAPYGPDDGVLAVTDYYGGAVHLYCRGRAASNPHLNCLGLSHVQTVLPSPARRRRFERPSSVAFDYSQARAQHATNRHDPDTGLDYHDTGADRELAIRMLVAETGGMCVSVFRVVLARHASWRLVFTHTCDICTEQLGTGVHKPLASQWSWLGVCVTEAGDVVVADMDNGCVYLV